MKVYLMTNYFEISYKDTPFTNKFETMPKKKKKKIIDFYFSGN